MPLDNIPTEIILDVMEKQNLEELRGLCSANSTFREHCNRLARKELQKLGSDYELYIRLSQFHITIHTYEGDIRFAKCSKNNIMVSITNLFHKMQIKHDHRSDVSYKLNNERQPDHIHISFDHYDNPFNTFILNVQGPFTDRQHAYQIIDQVINMWNNGM